MSHKPEILAPAGNIEKLKIAINYGADAVYVGGQKFGLRARADNFTDTELAHGVAYAHARQSRVYVTLNAYLHDEDFEGLDSYCQYLESIGVDAVIVSDLGVLRTVVRSSKLRVHLSTQASCLNTSSAKLWKSMGVSRIVLGRETSVAEAGEIAKEAGLEVEIFIHGALCMAYSGNCTISNFTAGRDSNRGGCIQSCRFPYQQESSRVSTSKLQVVAQQEVESPFMSSKDLLGTEVIEELFAHGISSLKIEGRMKSPFYVASACKTYRRLIDAYEQSQLDSQLVAQANDDLLAVPHRGYTSASLMQPAGADSVCENEAGESSTFRYMGMVLDTSSDSLYLRLHAPLKRGDVIDFMPHSLPNFSYTVDSLRSVRGEHLDEARQDSVIRIDRTSVLQGVDPLSIVRVAQESF